MTLARLGPYELVRPLGQGAAGTVYRARHVELGVERAVKVVRATPSSPGRFGREVRALASVRHPNVVAVHEVFEGAPPEPAWLAMDLVDGEPLADALERGPLPLDQALDVSAQVARGLDALHALGIVHRDVKPANVLLARDGRAVVVDLGMALAVGRDERLTRTGAVVGTPLYLAPELLAGAQATPATDVHALGLLLYECVTGRAAYLGAEGSPEGASGVLARIASRSRPRPSEVDPGLPHALDGLCARALALDPRDRPARGGAFADLVDALRRDPGPSHAEVRRRRRAIGRGVALGLLAASAALAVIAARRPAAREPADEAAPLATPAPVATAPDLDGRAGGGGLPPAPPGVAPAKGAARADALLAKADRAARAGRRCVTRLEHPAGSAMVRARFVDAGHVVTLCEKDGRIRLWALDALEPVAEAVVGPARATLVVLGDRLLVHAEAGILPLTLPRLLVGPALAAAHVRMIEAAPDGTALLLIGSGQSGAEVQRLDPVGWARTPVVATSPDPTRPLITRLLASSTWLVLATEADKRDGLTGDATRLLAFALPEGSLRREQVLPSRASSLAVDPLHPDRFAIGMSSGDVILSDLTIDPLTGPDELRLRVEGTPGRDVMNDAAHVTGVRGVAFTPDGERLVSVSSWPTDPSQDELRWWSVATGRPAGDLLRPSGPMGVQVSPDGRLIVIDSRGSAAEVWAVPP